MPPSKKGGDDVDLDALRAKYSRPKEQLRAEAEAQYKKYAGSSGQDAVDALGGTELKVPVIMCQQCQAHGVVKRQYGYRVIDEVCEVCDGEGMVIRGKGKMASDELCAKIRRVEKLISESDDLDELDRLESALRERSIVSLDRAIIAAVSARAEKPLQVVAAAPGAEPEAEPPSVASASAGEPAGSGAGTVV